MPTPDVSSMAFTRENSHHSPLADALLAALPMVEEVTIGHAFVTVRKVPEAEAVKGAKAFADYFHHIHGESIHREEEAMRKAAEGANGGGGPFSYADPMTADQRPEEEAATTGGEVSPSSSPSPSEPPLEEEAIVSIITHTSWEDLKMHISALLTDFLFSDAPPLSLDAPPPHQDTLPEAGDSEVLLAIKELVRTAIRPLLQEDGGDIRLESFLAEKGEMRVEFLGACRKCHSRHNTLTDLIERTTQHWIPEVRHVVAVERPSFPPSEATASTREGRGERESSRTTVGESEEVHPPPSPPLPIAGFDEASGGGGGSTIEGKGSEDATATASLDDRGGCVDVKHSKACLRLEGTARLVRHVEQKSNAQWTIASTSL